MMHDHYYTTPRSGNNMRSCRSRFSRHDTRENWPYRRVHRRRLSDSFSSNNFHPKYNECECCTRWNYDSDYYPRHVEPYYPDDDYMNCHRTGLTPAYQMLRIDSDHIAFFVEKSKLEAVLGNASGFIDKSKIPVRIELEDPVSGQFYSNKSEDQFSAVDLEGYDGRQRIPWDSSESKEFEINDRAESDDSDSTIFFQNVYPNGKGQSPKNLNSRNDINEENYRTLGCDERNFSIPLKSESNNRKCNAKMSNSPRQGLENHAGYFTKQYKEYLKRNVDHSPEAVPVDLAITKRYSEACKLTDYDFAQVRNPSQYNDSINRWFNNHEQPASSNSSM